MHTEKYIICSEAGWKVGGGGGSREILTIITKEFLKNSIVLQKSGGPWPFQPLLSEDLDISRL